MSIRAASALRLDDQICFALYSAGNAVVRAYRPLLQRLGLTYPQYLVMLVLWQDGPSTVGGVAERLQLDSHAVSPLIGRLVDAGLLERQRGEDRRRVEVSLTAAGRELEREAAGVQAEVVCATGLGPLQLARLRDELTRLAAHLGGAPDLADEQASPTEGEVR